ncbi:hypothetical protein N0V84_012103 [Fusarium piperis]|uniref:Uncharacterized protein n=1 Tax=Fusarium piperis TaxID=1435070 RepID=A0A9W8T9X5_9HYPO|nr:hypothetical protein N0V84_012103 [Fusarium piperis]
MKEIGLEGHSISPNACSEPFPLFSEEAIKQMGAEIFSENILEKCYRRCRGRPAFDFDIANIKISYHLEVLEERIRAKGYEERKLAMAKKKYDIPSMRDFLEELREFIDSMLTEIVEVEDD